MPDNSVQKVLILEDEPVISNILLRIIKAKGMVANVAENGVVAKEKLSSGEKYDLFVFDIRTPIVNGIQLYEYMEEKYPELTKKVIFMTGDCLNTATSTFLERVKQPVISKPFTPDQMLGMINQALHPKLTNI
jgi:DNA-binding NtrC family response regulator